jgi:hypothetical protein
MLRYGSTGEPLAATIATVTTWRCPHCGTPQAESARCWVCRRSATCCATCRHYRRAVAGNLGFCGLDPRRQPLDGDAIRGCWEAAAPTPASAPDLTVVQPGIAFIPIDEVAEPPAATRADSKGVGSAYGLFELEA